MAYGIDGLTGARRVAGVWAILGLVAVYFAGARLLGRVAAASAVTLLALHVIEVWFGRYPNAEAVMQALLFAALLANARAHADGDRFFAPVAGIFLALLLFLRIDAVVAIGAVVAANLLAFVTRQARRTGLSSSSSASAWHSPSLFDGSDASLCVLADAVHPESEDLAAAGARPRARDLCGIRDVRAAACRHQHRDSARFPG